MDLSLALIKSAQALSGDDGAGADFRYDLLDWIADSGLLKLTVQEREIQVREKYYQFSVRGDPKEGESVFGFGRGKDKRTAATIAVNEVLERLVSRGALRAQNISAPFRIAVEGGEITIGESESASPLPTPGFHSSNGWAVHFSAKTAIENAAREALERHILLLSYLKDGWAGFLFDEAVPFSGATLIPGIARVEAGGFRAGIVLTTGPEAPGATFGYLCAAGSEFEKSKRWLGAFFESYEQWMDLTARKMPGTTPLIEQYQWHYLKGERPALPVEPAVETSFPKVCGNLAVFDLSAALQSPFPLYAAFVFGGDLVPLFLRQKLSADEAQSVQERLAYLGVTAILPEYHPIL